jgi:hypothetical protein
MSGVVGIGAIDIDDDGGPGFGRGIDVSHADFRKRISGMDGGGDKRRDEKGKYLFHNV